MSEQTPVAATVKGALKSKSVWVGVLTAAAAVVQYAAPVVPPEYNPLLMALGGLLNAGVRFFTSKPLSEK